MKTDLRSARILEVLTSEAGASKVVLMIGATELELAWQGEAPVPGDVFAVTLAADGTPQIGAKIGEAEPGAWTKEADALRWRKRDASGKNRMEILWQRHAIRRAVRDYMDSEGFIEIDTPLLVHGTTPDAAIDSFAVGDRFLVTSTEYQIKRLEIAGFDKSYTLTQNYRLGDDTSSYRNPEFTMIEWARVSDTLASIEHDAEMMTWHAHKALGGSGLLEFQGHKIDLTPPWDRLSIAEAVQTYLGVPLPDFSAASLRRALEAAKLEIREGWADDRIFLFSLLSEHLQQFLGFKKPVFLTEWPSFQTSSTLGKAGTETAERSELFIAGIEISDGFPTLTDLKRQRESFAQQMQRRQDMKLPPAALDDMFLEAMRAGLPKGAGMALGFDRLVMVLTNQTQIRNVLSFAWDEV